MNLLGPAIVRDLVTLIQRPEADPAVTVLVFTSADKDYFISHVDLNRVSEYRAQAGKLTGEPSLTLLFRYLSASHLVTIAQIHGRVRGADKEFVLACDMRFAARENSLFGQIEAVFGLIPGVGGAGYLVRLIGRGRALEVLLSADDYDAVVAERYGWINRAVPADDLDELVRALAQRIAAFPAAGRAAIESGERRVACPGGGFPQRLRSLRWSRRRPADATASEHRFRARATVSRRRVGPRVATRPPSRRNGEVTWHPDS